MLLGTVAPLPLPRIQWGGDAYATPGGPLLRSRWALFTALALGAAAWLAIPACRPAADPQTLRFRFWGDTEEIKVIQGLLTQFEAAHPGVHIKAERKNPDGTYADELLAEFAVHSAPDVMFLSTDNVDVVSKGFKLADLNRFLAQDPDLKASDYYQAIIRRFTRSKRLVALPRDVAPVACIYYNKALFDQAGLAYPKDGWTWDDLRSDAIKLTHRDASGQPSQLGFADDWNLVDAWILSSGGRQVDDFAAPTRFTFAERKSLDGILFRWKLMQKDRVMPSSEDGQALSGGPAVQFVAGHLAMFHSGLWKTPSFRAIQGFDWDVAPFPRKKGVKPRYWGGGSGYGIRADAANPALCWELVKFMAGPIGQERLAASGLAQPALRAMAKSPAFLDGQKPANKRMLLACAEHMQASPAWTRWTEFGRTVWAPMTDPLWIKGYSGDPVALIKQVQAQGNERFFGIRPPAAKARMKKPAPARRSTGYRGR